MSTSLKKEHQGLVGFLMAKYLGADNFEAILSSNREEGIYVEQVLMLGTPPFTFKLFVFST